MAFTSPNGDPKYLRGIVDMGSNGIRFSISTIQPTTARIMPTLYQHRAGISLYDAQYSASGTRQPIDDKTIQAVITAFQHFKRTCADFAVPEEHITALATEATRTAINSEDFRARIKKHLGWDVKMLAKEDEGRVGAMGIASSLPRVSGLVMDLGGGSTQLSWLVCDGQGAVQMPEQGAVSMPYGAAAMSRRLAEAEKTGSVATLWDEVQQAVKNAYDSLNIPETLLQTAQKDGGFTLYLSGGGFRGWGYVLMSRHQVRPYPIPVINGFRASRANFLGVEEVKEAALSTLQNEDDEIFRVSDRRASQVPAVAFLITALAETLPQIQEVRFCQGGVREGYLYTTLSSKVQAEHPLVVATQPFSLVDSRRVVELLQNALPSTSSQEDYRQIFTPHLLQAFANMMYYHSSHSKDLQASAALRSTTSGILAGVHGLFHEHRTLLALLLCARWDADVPPIDQSFRQSLEQLVESPWVLWWINYLGAIAALVGAVYPAGVRDQSQEGRLRLSAKWVEGEKDSTIIELDLTFAVEADLEMFAKEVKAIHKIGKKKHRICGKVGVGYKVVDKTSTLSRRRSNEMSGNGQNEHYSVRATSKIDT